MERLMTLLVCLVLAGASSITAGVYLNYRIPDKEKTVTKTQCWSPEKDGHCEPETGVFTTKTVVKQKAPEAPYIVGGLLVLFGLIPLCIFIGLRWVRACDVEDKVLDGVDS